MKIMQQETYLIICIIKNIIKSLVLVYQEKQIRVFVNKLISQKN